MDPALEGVADRLNTGARVADVGCGHGAWLLVEPAAGDRVEDNLNPVGRAWYGLSTLLGVPGLMSREAGAALGAQAGEARLHEVATRAGFSRFRRVAETPFNHVYEVRG